MNAILFSLPFLTFVYGNQLGKYMQAGQLIAIAKQQREIAAIKNLKPSRAAVYHSRAVPSSPTSQAIARRSRALLEASKLLFSKKRTREAGLELAKHLSKSIKQKKKKAVSKLPCIQFQQECDPRAIYRTQSGLCNNLERIEVGSAFTPFRRLLFHAYQDGVNSPRSLAKNGDPLPSPRLVTSTVHETVDSTNPKITHMVMLWGQFTDHDITLTPISAGPTGQIFDCSSCNSTATISEECMPISIPKDDPVFDSSTCMTFVRSLPGQSDLGPREQLNEVSSFMDASQVYAPEVTASRDLREFFGGRLTSQQPFPGYHLMPGFSKTTKDNSVCRLLPCFRAGDPRNSDMPGLASLHTLWMREHNRVVEKLAFQNPHWDDEKLFQEGRKIVNAMLQHITYNEFLPKVLGTKMMKRFRLLPQTTGMFKGYRAKCNPTVTNEFAAAGFRFGHTLVNSFLNLVGDMDGKKHLDLREQFFNPEYLYSRKNNVDRLLMGYISQTSLMSDRFVTDALRNHLFGSLDLIALNLQRGRDHGIQPYINYRKLFSLSTPKSFDDLRGFMDNKTVDSIKNVYQHVEDIDLFTGLICERMEWEGATGPTASHIIAEQFRRLKICDRFFYENEGQPGSFTIDQLNEIRKIRLSHVFCRQLPLARRIQLDAFAMAAKESNDLLSCDNDLLKDINWLHWKEAGQKNAAKNAAKPLLLNDQPATCDCSLRGSLPNSCKSIGFCICLPGITGVKCDTCAPGFWGFNKSSFEVCQICKCDRIGSMSDICDSSTGRCRCRQQVFGQNCDRCPADHFLTNEGCIHETRGPKKCPAVFLCKFGGECRLKNGKPTCFCPTCDAQEHLKLICGSDGNTYLSPCEMRRAGCLRQISLQAINFGRCEKSITDSNNITVSISSQIDVQPRSASNLDLICPKNIDIYNNDL